MTTGRRRSPRTPDPDADNIGDFRYPDKRKNNPPAGLAAQGRIAEVPRQRYSYDPHLPPILRFDPTGKADALPALLEEAQKRPLNGDEIQLLAEALKNRQPWLEWAGKREKRWFEVDPVALHIHERVSAQAVLRIAARQDVQRTLWGDPEQEYHEAVQFYRHDIDWTNRLILGDSLVVMNSLAKREDLAGKVQMIYMDPPYGIKFASNFQPTIGNRDVKDREQDLTREPEMVKAYRDTWTLGVHSYLAYLRDRLIAAKELLADSGSIFVQIGDENLHLVRAVMDEVFGPKNFLRVISFKKSGSQSTEILPSNFDFLLWYALDKDRVRARQVLVPKEETGAMIGQDIWIERSNGEIARGQFTSFAELSLGEVAFTHRQASSPGVTASGDQRFEFQGRTFFPPDGRHWSVVPSDLAKAAKAEYLFLIGNSLRAKDYLSPQSRSPLGNVWTDTSRSGFAETLRYVVETSTKVIERCILMTTDPGDLVLDPTCGSGTTAYVAEQWGRRWITIDTSRVAIALARQRLLTARFDYFKTRDGTNQVHATNFTYKTVPHITLKSIAQNVALGPIFAKHQRILAEKLERLNLALKGVTPNLRATLLAKLEAKRKRRDRNDPVTDADERRWKLPKDKWEEWQVPFDADADWPPSLQQALAEYRAAWRAKMDEVNSCIAAAADQEELVDQPEVQRGILRVSGPFTVEAVQPAEESLDMDSPIGGEPDEPLETFDGDAIDMDSPTNAEAYLDKMIRLLRSDGVRFPDNKVMSFARLEPLAGGVLHAEGEWANGDSGQPRSVAVSFGPQYGPVTAFQVEECLYSASRRGYDDLVFAGFSFDGAAQAIIQDDPNPRVHIHMAHIRPDVNMGGLLKDTPSSQLFTVSGLPRTETRLVETGEWVVEMQGVDIYDPVSNAIVATGPDKVAAWFLDSDYDGAVFCITQAFFPDAKAWDRLARALKGTIDEDRFVAFSGTVSLPFPVGKHKRAAVKVIDPRGNEVMRVHRLEDVRYGH